MLFNRAAALLFCAGLVAVKGNPTPLTDFGLSTTGLTHSVGTAANISPDESVLYVTADDGTVLAIDPSNGSELWQHKVGGANSCKSGISFSPDGTKFAVAVSDTDAGTGWVVVYAHDPSAGTTLWVSDEIKGMPSGTPVFGSDNDSLYLTYNSGGEGVFSAFSMEANTTATYTEGYADLKADPTIAASTTYTGANAEWSPVGIARNPDPAGNYRDGEGNSNDVVVWAHRAISGDSNIDSFSYVYQQPKFSTMAEKVTILAGVKWSTWTAPIFTEDGQGMCFAVSKGALRCWTDGQQFQLGSDVKSNPTRKGPDPVNSNPVLSPDETKAFFATNRKEFWGVDVVTEGLGNENRTLWVADNLDELPDAGAIVTPGGETAIVITQSGRAHAIDTEDGSYRWIYPTPGAAPAQPVSADASLSSDGTKLWFVGTSGALSAWHIDKVVIQTTTTTTTTTTTSSGITVPTSSTESPPVSTPATMPSTEAPGDPDDPSTTAAPDNTAPAPTPAVPVSPTAPPFEVTGLESSAVSFSLGKGIGLACAAVAWKLAAMI